MSVTTFAVAVAVRAIHGTPFISFLQKNHGIMQSSEIFFHKHISNHSAISTTEKN